jgi:hypothetical protein
MTWEKKAFLGCDAGAYGKGLHDEIAATAC